MPNFIVISSIISLYLCGFICKGWVREIGEESSVKRRSMQFMTSSRESNPWKGHVWTTWLEAKKSLLACHFASNLEKRPSREVLLKHSVLQKVKLLYQILYPHCTYPHYPQIVRSVFQRENPNKYTWELEIVILTIIYTFPLGFPLLLPLHRYILKRFLSQTFTTPNLSVKWGFGAVGKYWKEPFSGRCNRVQLRDSES